MNPYQYKCSIKQLFSIDDDTIIGQLTQNNSFDTNRKTVESWLSEISTLRTALRDFSNEDGLVAFEYTIPRVDGRIDCVVGLRGLVFVLEFKTGSSQDDNVDKAQLEQYVTDLKNFHYESYDTPLVPMWVVPDAELSVPRVLKPSVKEKVFPLVTVSKETISETIKKVLKVDLGNLEAINTDNWLLSPYCPTSNIIEAARKLYAEHEVEDINISGAKGEDLLRTTDALMNLISKAREQKEKYLCLVTGVPGAGKTLIGLTVATRYKAEDRHDNRSVYLSGNRPLVMVLQEALTRDAVQRKKDKLESELASIIDKAERKAYKKVNKVTKAETESEIKQFIQLIPNWRSEYLKGICVSGQGENVSLIKDTSYRYKGTGDWYVPYDHVSIYDEAQRAWEAKENSKYVRQKESHLKNFPEWSEPRFLLSCMDRHDDWAVYICLIGNGQDINHGEAGTVEWMRSIKHFRNWKVYAPHDILNDANVAAEVGGVDVNYDDCLHLSTDLRSIRADNLAKFVDCLLNIETEEARNILTQLDKYPIRLTRDLQQAKNWIKSNARSTERFGALASSKGQRLKPDALVLLPTNADKKTVVHWFLGDRKLVTSSYYMEDVATEFQVQGLEIDWALVAWDADMRYNNGCWSQHRFNGGKWQNINKEDIRRYQVNAYRVILTRARRGMVIYVPTGSDEDHTRNRKFYDGTYAYLKSLGIKEL
ncbi:MAG: DNA/RNA helicase domain-containing protein [Bacteroidales bacterium]|nr:DNA/RNA helicase domain-containing protein [Bacteroidales bacterium]